MIPLGLCHSQGTCHAKLGDLQQPGVLLQEGSADAWGSPGGPWSLGEFLRHSGGFSAVAVKMIINDN